MDLLNRRLEGAELQLSCQRADLAGIAPPEIMPSARSLPMCRLVSRLEGKGARKGLLSKKDLCSSGWNKEFHFR